MADSEQFETIDRRRLLRRLGAVAAGGVAVAAADVVLAGRADATVGAMQYGTANDAGGAATDLTSSTVGAVLRLHATNTTGGKGLFAEAQGSTAIWGETVKDRGVVGMANAPGGTDGVYGGSHSTADGAGVHGHHYTGDNAGVLGTIGPRTGLVGTAAAVMGDSEGHPGVAGLSTNFPGVEGSSFNAYGGLFGGTPGGVLGTTRFGTVGVEGHCGDVSGFNPPNAGVLGDCLSAAGVVGLSKNGIGLFGRSQAGDGVSGTSTTGAGVTGIATGQGVGVHGVADATGAVGVLASVESGVTGASALGVQGAALLTGPTTLSGTTKLTGKTHFSRSGTVTIAAGHKSATTPSISLSADSLVIATIQSGPTTNAVAQAKPNVSGSNIKITLQKNATSATTVAYLVID